ncbi:hypothetical protein D3C77_551140 [compost metagenome]
MPEANVGGGRDICKVMLVANKTAGQGICSGIAVGGAGCPIVLGRRAVQTSTANNPVLIGGVPGQFAEGTVVVEIGIFGPGHVLVYIDAHTAALAMLVGLSIDACDQL